VNDGQPKQSLEEIESSEQYLSNIDAARSDDTNALYQIAKIYYDSGHLEQAKKFAQKLTALDSPMGANLLGILEFDAGNIESACRYWEQSAADGEGKAMQNLAIIAVESGDFALANDWLMKARLAGTEIDKTYLGNVAFQSGDVEGAKTWWEEASSTGSGEAMYWLALMTINEIDKTKSKAWLRKSADAGFAEAMNKLGQLADQEGDQELATEWWAKAAKLRAPEPDGETPTVSRSLKKSECPASQFGDLNGVSENQFTRMFLEKDGVCIWEMINWLEKNIDISEGGMSLFTISGKQWSSQECACDFGGEESNGPEARIGRMLLERSVSKKHVVGIWVSIIRECGGYENVDGIEPFIFDSSGEFFAEEFSSWWDVWSEMLTPHRAISDELFNQFVSNIISIADPDIEDWVDASWHVLSDLQTDGRLSENTFAQLKAKNDLFVKAGFELV